MFHVNFQEFMSKSKVNMNQCIVLACCNSILSIIIHHKWILHFLIFFYCLNDNRFNSNDHQLTLKSQINNKLQLIIYIVQHIKEFQQYKMFIFLNIILMWLDLMIPFIQKFTDKKINQEKMRIQSYIDNVKYNKIQIKNFFAKSHDDIQYKCNIIKKNLIKMIDLYFQFFSLLFKFIIISIGIALISNFQTGLIFSLFIMSSLFISGIVQQILITNNNGQIGMSTLYLWQNLGFVRKFMNLKKITYKNNTKFFWINFLLNKQLVNLIYYSILLVIIPYTLNKNTILHKTKLDFNLAIILFLLLTVYDYHNFYIIPNIIRLKFNIIKHNKNLNIFSNNMKHKKIVESVYFNEVIFTYDKNKKPIINQMTLLLEKNNWIHISSKTGGGKSLFVKLLFGLNRPTAGNIMIKYQNNDDVFNMQNLNIHHLIKSFSYLENTLDINVSLMDFFKSENSHIEEKDVLEALNHMGILQDLLSKFQNIFTINLSLQNNILNKKDRFLIFLASTYCKKSFIITENCLNHFSKEDQLYILYLLEKYFHGGILLEDKLDDHRIFKKKYILNVNKN